MDIEEEKNEVENRYWGGDITAASNGYNGLCHR